jgi:hypothetical protein
LLKFGSIFEGISKVFSFTPLGTRASLEMFSVLVRIRVADYLSPSSRQPSFEVRQLDKREPEPKEKQVEVRSAAPLKLKEPESAPLRDAREFEITG